MADFFGSNVTGAEKIAMNLRLMEKGVEKDVEAAVMQGMSKIAERAKIILAEKNHIKTGNLRDSIMPLAVVGMDKTTVEGYAGSFYPGTRGYSGNDAPYAPKIEALPDGGFLAPAYNENKSKVEKWIADAILVRILRLRSRL